MAKKAGVKFDTEKLAMDCLPVIGLLLQGDVYTRGKNKYGAHNWRNGIEYSRILSAQLRHWLWYMAGERFDPEDGQHHQASIAWAANTIMEYELSHPEKDDRYIPFPPEKLRELLANMKAGKYVKKESKKRTTKKRPRNKRKQ